MTVPPKMALNDGIVILKNKDNQLIFYDLQRQKLVAQCYLRVIDYQVAGDYLIIKTSHGWRKLVLPFLPEAMNGDFFLYCAIDSVLPNPFTSIKDFIPSSKLESLTEFAVFPSCWSSLHHAAISREEGRITQGFEKLMKFYNDVNGNNMFNLAIQSQDPKIILEAMKNLLLLQLHEL